MSDIFGTGGDDTLPGTAGDDVFHGLEGRDTAQIASPSTGAVFSLDSQNRWVVTSPQGVDTMDSIEAIAFSDGSTVTADTLLRINAETARYQGDPVVAQLADGGWVAVWLAQRPGDVGANYSEVYLQRYDARGAVGEPVLVNTTAAQTRTPSVTGLKDGGFAVTWGAYGTGTGPGGDWDVYGQVFAADGSRIGGELVVSHSTAGLQFQGDHALGATSTGGFVAIYASAGMLYAQRFSENGTRVGSESPVHSVGDSALAAASIMELPAGGYVAMWRETNGLAAAMPLDGGLAPHGEVARFGGAAEPAMEPLPGADGWLIAYVRDGALSVSRFSSSNVQFGSVQVTDMPVRTDPALAVLAGNSFVVAWVTTAFVDGRWQDAVYLQRFDAQQQKIGGAQLVDVMPSSDSPAFPMRLDITALPDGGFVVAWRAPDGDGYGVFAQRYDSSGTPTAGTGSLSGDAGPNTIRFAGEGAIGLAGLDGGDFLQGGAGADTIDGGNGNDVLRGGGGNDLVTGGAGFDTVVLEDAVMAAGWQVSVDRVVTVATPSGGTDTFSGVEQVQGAGDAAVHLGGIANLQVNADPGKQYVPRVAPLPDGGFAMTWSEVSEGAKGTWAYAATVQRFDAAGAPVASAVRLGSDSVPQLPSIASFANGDYVVVWSSHANGGRVLAQRFDATGAKVGAATTVSEAVNYFGHAPEVVALNDGGYLVTWASPDGNGQGIFSQRMDAAGAKAGGTVEVNTTGHAGAAGVSHQLDPAVALLADGGWVVLWASAGDATGVYAQRFDASGARVGGEALVSSSGSDPDVVTLLDGGFVAAWTQAGHVMAQRFDAAGSTAGAAFRVDAVSGDPAMPVLTALPDGGWMVAWQSYWSDVYAQRFDAAGQRVGEERLVNAITAADQRYPELATLADGSVLATWAGGTWDRYVGQADIFVQRFEAGLVPDTYLTFAGGAQDDVLRAGSLGERVRIDGGAGNDVLAGAPGTDDVLAGGSGDDTFEFAGLGNGADLITDWSPGDRIVVAGAQFAGAVTSGDGASVAANGVQVATTGVVTTLFIGTDATPGADVVIELAGSFAAAEFSAAGDSITWSGAAPPPPPPPGGDATAPVPVDFFPAAGSNTLPPDWSLAITFDEAVRAGPGTITLQTAAGQVVQTFAGGDPGLRFMDSSVVIDPAADLLPGTTYRLVVGAGAIEDLAGNDYAGLADYGFTTTGEPPAGGDAGAPVAVDFFPAAGSNTLPPDWSLAITFNEAVQSGSGTVTLQTATGQVVQTFAAGDPGLRFMDSGVVIDPAADLLPGTTYRLVVGPGAIRDLEGNAYGGVADYGFTTTGEPPAGGETGAPVAVDFFPTAGSNTLPPDWSLAITFNEAVQAGSGTVTLQTAAGQVVQTFAAGDPGLRFMDSSVVIDPAADLLPGTTYRLVVGSGAIRDLEGNAYAGVSDYTFTTAGEPPSGGDTTAPVAVDFFPAAGSNTLPPDWSLAITFDEAVQAGSGSVTLQTAAGQVVQTFAAGDPGLRFMDASVVIDPAADLRPGTTYRLVVAADAIEDLAGNAYAGVSDYTFTTAGAPAQAMLKLVGVMDMDVTPMA